MLGKKHHRQHQGFDIIAGIVFLVVGVLHLLRAVAGWDLLISSSQFPIWLSVLLGLVALALAGTAFTLARK